MEGLFREYKLKNTIIKNRIVMPPMVCPGWADGNGIVTEKHIKYYEERAKGEVGLIIVEAHSVSKEGRIFDSQLGIWSNEQIEGLSKIAIACHKYGAKVLLQVYHAGLKTPKSISDNIIQWIIRFSSCSSRRFQLQLDCLLWH